jgi:Zn-dependent protease
MPFSQVDFAKIFSVPGLVTLLGILYSIVLHEAAHAFAADRFGDPTPRAHGRLTLNPLPVLRADPFFTLLLPIMTWISYNGQWAIGGGFTPIDGAYFRARPVADLVVSLVGPMTNLTLCVLFSALLCIPGLAPSNTQLYLALGLLASINLILALFNILPIPPLDGSSVLAVLVPPLRPLFDRVRGAGLSLMLVVFIGWPLFGYIAPPVMARYMQALSAVYNHANGPGTFTDKPFGW